MIHKRKLRITSGRSWPLNWGIAMSRSSTNRLKLASVLLSQSGGGFFPGHVSNSILKSKPAWKKYSIKNWVTIWYQIKKQVWSYRNRKHCASLISRGWGLQALLAVCHPQTRDQTLNGTSGRDPEYYYTGPLICFQPNFNFWWWLFAIKSDTHSNQNKQLVSELETIEKFLGSESNLEKVDRTMLIASS